MLRKIIIMTVVLVNFLVGSTTSADDTNQYVTDQYEKIILDDEYREILEQNIEVFYYEDLNADFYHHRDGQSWHDAGSGYEVYIEPYIGYVRTDNFPYCRMDIYYRGSESLNLHSIWENI